MKTRLIVAILAGSLMMTGCSVLASDTQSQSVASEYMQRRSAEKTLVVANERAEQIENTAVSTDTVIDLDLSQENALMAYSTIESMLNSPDEYIGKVVKVKGIYGIGTGETAEELHNAVAVFDQGGCCYQVLEFGYNDDMALPELGETITVTGVFTVHNYNGNVYTFLENAIVN